MINKPSSKSILAVIQKHHGHVTPADVSIELGMPIFEAIKSLNSLAASTSSMLKVTNTGNILYCFLNINRYTEDQIIRLLKKLALQLLTLCHRLVTFLFNIMLSLSPFMIFLALISTPLFLLSFPDTDCSPTEIRGIVHIISMIIGLILIGVVPVIFLTFGVFGLFAWNDVFTKFLNKIFSAYSYFLKDCQSFVVGQSRDARHFDSIMWQTVARFIFKRQGVVTSEELAQFTGLDNGDNDGVFPVLIRFEGRPEVTNTGNIVYTFPSLLKTTSKMVEDNILNPTEEPRWSFTPKGTHSILVLLYAAINFIAYISLLTTLNPHAHLHWLTIIVYSCLTFSIFFFIYPLCRFFALTLLNSPIDRRNSNRRMNRANLENPSQELKLKLREASNYEAKYIDVDQEKIIYRTDKDSLEQQFEL